VGKPGLFGVVAKDTMPLPSRPLWKRSRHTGDEMKRLASLALAAVLSGCAVISQPVSVPSTLLHGADSQQPVESSTLKLASDCLFDKPLFWARYFNHTAVAERLVMGKRSAHRKEISYSSEEDALLRSGKMRLVPVFAQNVNSLDEAAGRAHGEINAQDLISNVGSERLVHHMADHPLFVFLDQESSDPVLTREYWNGWVRGLKAGLATVGVNTDHLRPALYGRPNNAPGLATAISALLADPSSEYAGLWLVMLDDDVLKPSLPAHRCGKLARWDDVEISQKSPGPILMRQYVLDARAKAHASVDLNALNPRFQEVLLEGFLEIDSP
jgi:hypothetical protein